jgi:uncharacterized protein (DUF1800 family)
MNRREFLTGKLSYAGGRSRFERPMGLPGLEPYTGPWTYAEASHLLRRTMFGAKKADVEAVLAKTAAQAVDMLLAPPSAPNPPAPIKYNGDGSDWTQSASTDTNTDSSWFSFLQTWFYQQMLMQPISINEKMTLFWHNHFSCGYNAVKDSRYMAKQDAMLRTNALGNFKVLAKEITFDPAMLRYLNGNQNIKSAPNENYGRELQELFTIGKGPEISPGNYTNYSEADVKAAAHVLSGWTDVQNPTPGFSFNNSNHDSSNKQFSADYGNTVIQGRTGQFGAEQEIDDLLTMILGQNATAQYICRKIYRFFVSTYLDTEIETTIITPLADLLKSGSYEIKPVLDKLFKSAHFYDAVIQGDMMKNPIDLCMAMMRTFPIDSLDKNKVFYETFPPVENNVLHWVFRPFRRLVQAPMGWDLFNPPNVAGLPAYYQEPQFDELWVNSDTLQKRIKYIDDLLIQGLIYDEGYGYAIVNVIEYAKMTSNPTDASTIVKEWAKWNFAMTLTQAQLDAAKALFLGSVSDADWTTKWNAYIANPGADGPKKEIEPMLRALLRHLLGLGEYQQM